MDFWRAAGGRSRLPPAVLLILPAAAACPALNLSETRAAGLAVTLSAAGPTRIIQHRGCGGPGHSLTYAWSRRPGDSSALMVLLVRLLFGVFPEAGEAGSLHFPLFHQSEDRVSFK